MFENIKTIIPLWLLYYEEKLSEETKILLGEISASTIDKILEATRKRCGKLGVAYILRQ